jgi:hypothetical protein
MGSRCGCQYCLLCRCLDRRERVLRTLKHPRGPLNLPSSDMLATHDRAFRGEVVALQTNNAAGLGDFDR